MSKQNKVNPGMYTQAGRLTPDDTARELKKQREVAPPRRSESEPPAPRDASDNETEETEEGDQERE